MSLTPELEKEIRSARANDDAQTDGRLSVIGLLLGEIDKLRQEIMVYHNNLSVQSKTCPICKNKMAVYIETYINNTHHVGYRCPNCTKAIW